jgi:hypothetical protein
MKAVKFPLNSRNIGFSCNAEAEKTFTNPNPGEFITRIHTMFEENILSYWGSKRSSMPISMSGMGPEDNILGLKGRVLNTEYHVRGACKRCTPKP